MHMPLLLAGQAPVNGHLVSPVEGTSVIIGHNCNKVTSVIRFGHKCNKVTSVIRFGHKCNKVTSVIRFGHKCNNGSRRHKRD